MVQQHTLSKLNALSFNGFELYSDVYQEIVITKSLSNLHSITCDQHGYEYQAHSFPKIYSTKIVHGEIPNYFIIRKFDENNSKVKPVERFDEVHGVPKESLTILMKYCGDSLWHLMKHKHRIGADGTINGITADQLLSVCYQVTFALAVAESIYQFEHRDLHVCNILVKRTKKECVTFIIKSMTYKVKSFGVKACIIDATFSRICLGTNVYFTDLTNRLKGTATNPNPDSQEETYQRMYNKVIDKWTDWYPETNIYWCKYFFSEVLASQAFVLDCNDNTKKNLNNLIKSIWQYRTLTEFVQSMFNVSIPANSRIKTQTSSMRDASS